ncbi:MAG: TIGR00730 family Rossman fold protein [Pseudomonadota bacterium]
MKKICVFLGSNRGADPCFSAGAKALGRELVSRDLTLVYGGSGVGLMADLADEVLEVGGKVIGVIPRLLVEKEKAHPRLEDLRVVESMHQRKAAMAELADGFIALPGGLGTLDELFEVLTWAQLGYHRKPVGLLDLGGYYAYLGLFLDQARASGFLRSEHRDMLLSASDPAALLNLFQAHRPAVVDKWLDREAAL